MLCAHMCPHAEPRRMALAVGDLWQRAAAEVVTPPTSNNRQRSEIDWNSRRFPQPCQRAAQPSCRRFSVRVFCNTDRLSPTIPDALTRAHATAHQLESGGGHSCSSTALQSSNVVDAAVGRKRSFR